MFHLWRHTTKTRTSIFHSDEVFILFVFVNYVFSNLLKTLRLRNILLVYIAFKFSRRLSTKFSNFENLKKHVIWLLTKSYNTMVIVQNKTRSYNTTVIVQNKTRPYNTMVIVQNKTRSYNTMVIVQNKTRSYNTMVMVQTRSYNTMVIVQNKGGLTIPW
jgi:hypothetical protein